MKRKTSEKSGTARMLELGKKPLTIWLGPTLHSQLKRIAKEKATTMSGYALEQIRQALAQDAGQGGADRRQGQH